MQVPVRFRPLAPSAGGGGGGGGGGAFSASLVGSVREWRRGRTCRKFISFSSAGKGGEEAGRRETPEETRKRLEELDALLEGLVEPKMRPPTPPPPPDPYLDRAMITGRASEELPEFSPTYVAFSTLGLVILTIFTNVMFNLYVKPSVDGFDPPEKIQRVPLVNPAERRPSE